MCFQGMSCPRPVRSILGVAVDKNTLIDGCSRGALCMPGPLCQARKIHGTRQRLIVMWLDSCLLGAFVGRLARVVVSNRCRHHNWRDSSTANEGVDVDECESRWKLCRDCYVVLKNRPA